MFDGGPGASAPRTKGVTKLLTREATLREWIKDGRDNYELARAFHVPIADVRTVIALLNLVRPAEYEAAAHAEPQIEKECSYCRNRFEATRYRFRCDECLEMHSTWSEQAYFAGSIR